jgi:hypothetical protein
MRTTQPQKRGGCFLESAHKFVYVDWHKLSGVGMPAGRAGHQRDHTFGKGEA